MYQVTLTACTAGNPLQAWKGTTGEDDTEHVPNDVWEDLSFDFDDLDEAKAYVESLDPQMTTHVKIFSDDEQIHDQDASGDHLADAAPGVAMPHTVDTGTDDDVVPEAPPAFSPPESAAEVKK